MRKYKFKVKVKHLVIGLAVVFVGIPFLFYAVGDTMLKSEREFFGTPIKYYGKTIYEIYTRLPKVIRVTGEDYNKMGLASYNPIKDKYIYSDYGYGGPNVGNKTRILNAIEMYKSGIELGEKDNFYCENISMLISSYMGISDIKNAEKYTSLAINSDNKEIKITGILNKIVLLVKTGFTEDAIKLCENNIDEYEVKVLHLNLLYSFSEYNRFNEKLKEYNKEYLKEPEYISSEEEMSRRAFNSRKIQHLKYINYPYSLQFDNRNKGENVIRGTLSKNGVPIPYAEIIFGEKYYFDADNYLNLQNWHLGRIAFTDKDGNYEITMLDENQYSMTILVQGFLLEKAYISSYGNSDSCIVKFNNNKSIEQNFKVKDYISIKESKDIFYETDEYLKVSPPKVEGAKYVEIKSSVGAYGGIGLRSKLDEDGTFKIPLDKGGFIFWDFSAYTKNDKKYYNARYLIGTRSDTKLRVSFAYFNEKMEKISETVPGELEYTAKAKDFNEGDRLLIDGKLDEAVKWYEDKIKSGDVRREYLYALLNIYTGYNQYGDKRNKEKYEEYYTILEGLEIYSIEELQFSKRIDIDFNEENRVD